MRGVAASTHSRSASGSLPTPMSRRSSFRQRSTPGCWSGCSGGATDRGVRILVCPQEFKGSLTAFEATRHIADGVRAALPDAEIVEQPLADGGPGTVAIVVAASRGTLV